MMLGNSSIEVPVISNFPILVLIAISHSDTELTYISLSGFFIALITFFDNSFVFAIDQRKA
jgi:hypothetical protein